MDTLAYSLGFSDGINGIYDNLYDDDLWSLEFIDYYMGFYEATKNLITFY